MPDYKLATRRAALKWHVDPRILQALVQQESGFNPNAVSNADAHGIAQFIPSTAKAYGVNLNDGRVTDDLEGAAHYLADNLKKTGGNYHQALSIYNSGRPDAYRDPKFAKGQTYNYVKTILANAKNFGGGAGAGGGPSGQNGSAAAANMTTTTSFDQAGYDKARKLTILGNYLARRNPNNALVKMGLATPGALPDRADFTKTSTHTAMPSSSASGTPGGAGRRPSSQLLEEIYNTGGQGYAVKNGQKVSGEQVYGAVWGGHKDHVHIASGPKQVVELGKLALSMGLHVGENPHFGGVDPVHAPNSYHYKGQAIDVSGDPKKMAAFARKVEEIYGIR